MTEKEPLSHDPDVFRRVVESSTDGLWILDGDGVTLYANDRMAALLGRAPESMTGFSAYDAVDDVGRNQLRAHLADMTSGHPGQINLESRFERADGSTIWGLVSWQPLYDDFGTRLGWLHRVTEYTERKSLLERLKDSEQQLATAQRIAMIGSWDWDVAADRVSWSDQLYRIYNLEPQEFAATYQAFLDFVHPDDRSRVEQAVTSTFEGPDEFSWDARIIRKGGEVRWVRGLGRVERGPDGLPIRMEGTSQDITDVVRADAVAAAAARRLVLLHELATAANGAQALAEAFAMAADAIAEHSDWSAVCAYTVTPHTPGHDPGRDSANDSGPRAGTAGLECTLLGGRPGGASAAPDDSLARRALASGEIEHGAVGTPHPSRCLVAVPVLLDDRVTAMIEVVLDESAPSADSRRLLSQIAGQLALVAERERAAAQLSEARDEAMEASRLKSEFLATMSHEIRTPMNGVIGLNDLLLRTSLDEHQRRLADGLQSAGLTLLTIINDILDLSKIESGKFELEQEDFDVRAVFDQTAAMLSGPAHKKGLELVVACHPDVPLFLRGDSVRLGQVLTNLGANAVKFTDRGEVVLQATLAPAQSDRVVLRVDVTDTGVGISPDYLDTLFDAFTQADRSTTRRHGGTGLGLAISRQLVEALGGTITVTTEVGVGSTFSFTASFEHAHGAPVRVTGPVAPLEGRRVLVVDDNQTNRFILEEQLAAWQMRPVTVSSAEEALATLREAARAQQPFEIALLDLVMPGVDGLGLADRIHGERTLGQLSMLLLTSDDSVSNEVARDHHIRARLHKPVRHSELHDALLRIINPHPGGGAPLVVSGAIDVPSRGVRVLLVEDNHVNQMVASGLLQSLGYDVDTVGDGQAAISVLRGEHPYDVVLMDLRMPDIDGYDATRAIRADEAGRRRVPIIAMTASALEGEQERCLAVGMDDFIAKPVDPQRLDRALVQWTTAAETAPSVDTVPPPPLDGDVLDLARVGVLHELRMEGVSFFERTAAAFASRVPIQLNALRQAAASGDAATLKTVAHQLKGSALNLGLPRLGAAAAALDAASGQPTSPEAHACLDVVSIEAEKALAALVGATARLD